MKLTIYAKNMTVSPNVTRRIEKKTEKMGRYLLPDTEMQIRLSKEAKRDLRVVEITVPMGNNVFLRAEASEPENLFLAIDQALAMVSKGDQAPVPLHLRNAPTRLMKELGYAQDYKYAHDYPGHFVDQEFMPEAHQGQKFYEPQENAKETEIRNRMSRMWKKYGY